MAYEIKSGKIPTAKRIVVYGPEGIGKSTFASKFPGAVFIDTEGSTNEMDVARFPTPTSWTMLLDEVREVLRNPSLCQTLVIDTADWAEQLEITELCASKNWKGIEDAGYGKGYTYSAEEFGKLLNLLTAVSDKGVNIVITAHAQLRKIELPEEMGAYDHWEMKTSKKVAPMIREWATAVFFANYKTMVIEVDKKKKAQGGRRVMYANHTPFWDAKNRYGLPDEMPFEFESIAHLFTDTPAAPEPKKEQPKPAAKKPAAAKVKEPERPVITPTPEPVPAVDTGPAEPVDPAIHPKLRDLRMANGVTEWDVQNVVGEKGYMPADMPVRDYPEDFVVGWCVRWFDKIKERALQLRSEEAIPFN